MPYTFNQIKAFINEVECQPWIFRVGCLQCDREGFSENAGTAECRDDHAWFLQAQLWRVDTDSGEWGWGQGGKYFLSPHMTVGEVVKKCFVACRDYAEHEVREAFMWQGRRILGPHIGIHALWQIADETEMRD